MAAWSEGYFTEVQYTGHYYAHMAPGALTLAALRRGVRPPDLAKGATFLELGCGQGFGLNLLAAANPHIRFVGLDFHPGQIANARRLAAEAGLQNITFEDFSFEQALALPEGRLPRCEVVAAHGVISWISAENRARVVALLDRLVAPGGVAMVSYNTYPGWAPLLPLQRFIKAFVDRTPGPPEAAVKAALEAAQQMADAGDGTFAHTPQVKAAIGKFRSSDAAYVLHEVAHDHFHPMFHADVARELEAARLTYVGQASLIDELPSLQVAEKLRKTVEAAADPVWRETLMDYATDRGFRRDIYVRGLNRLTPAERADQLGGLRFALTKPLGAIGLDFKIRLGTLKGDPGAYQPMIEAMAKAPQRYDDLLRLPALAGNEALLAKALALLMEAGAVHPAVPGDVDAGPAKAFNRVLLDHFLADRTPGQLAAPAIGAGLLLNFAHLLALAAPDKDPAAAADLGWEILRRTGVRVQKGGKPIAGEAESKAELVQRIGEFEAAGRAQLKRLGVI